MTDTVPGPRPAGARRIRSVLMCGVGAVGSAYAEALHRLDPALVTVVARGERRHRLERYGLTVNGRHVDVRCVEAGGAIAPPDLLLVAVKQHHLAAAVDDLRGLVGPETIVVSLLNGVTSEDILTRALPSANVLHAFTLGNDVVRDGSHTRYSSAGKLVLGAATTNDPADPRVVAVKDLVERAGIPVIVPDDILREQWWKFVLNVGVNQVSAVLRATYGAFRAPEVRELTARAALEAVEVARRQGIPLGPADVERIFPIIGGLGPGGKTSMLQDVEAGRKTEVELFADTVVELGRRHGVATPVNELLGTLIRALEAMARGAAATP